MKKTLIVTGAAQGIGKAIVLRALEEECEVLACDKNQSALKDLSRELKSKDLSCYSLDVAHGAAVQSFFKEVSDRKTIWGLVNNAGVYLARSLADYSLAEISRVLDVNVKGAILFSQAFSNLLIKRKAKGVIVNLSSVSAFEGSSDPVYGSSKAALVGLTHSCALCFAPYIRVNAVAPGIVDTAMLKAIPVGRLKHFRKSELIKDKIKASDVAESVWFLLSDRSKNRTGTILDINNGGYFR